MNSLKSKFKLTPYMSRISLLFITILLLPGCSGCSGRDGGTQAAVSLSSLAITPDTLIVASGATINFTATGTYSDGSSTEITSQATWVSADTAIIMVGNNSGVVTGVTEGVTTVTASMDGVSATRSITVTAALITEIVISPAAPSSTAKGIPVTFTATATFSDGSTGNVSTSVNWVSSNASVVALDATGIAATLSQGSTNISASINGVTSNSSSLTVTAPVLVSLSITSSPASIAQGNTGQLVVSGSLSDGTPASLGTLLWSFSNDNVVSIDNTGLATPLSLGYTNISVSSGAINSNTVTLSIVPFEAPIGVFAVSAPGQVTVSWSLVNGADSYNIYWSTTADVTTASSKIADASSPYVHSGLTDGNTYYYRVSAVNSSGEPISNEHFSFLYTGGNPTGSFGATGSMSALRIAHTATLLINGKVLVTGGGNGSNTNISADLYDPTTGLFAATGNMLVPRQNHTATLLPSGKVLVTGGVTTTTPIVRADIYDPATGLFTATSNMTIERTDHTATLLPNGQVLIIGGGETAELYDPATGLFTATGSLLTARSQHRALLLANGKVLVTGGSDGINNIASAELYDPISQLFTSIGNMTLVRNYHNATLLANGKVLISGGLNEIYSLPNTAELFDQITGGFSVTGSMVSGRHDHTSTLLSNGKVLLTGGQINDNAEIYAPDTGTFTATGNMLTTKIGHTATLLTTGDVLVTGGMDIVEGIGSVLSSAELLQ